MGRTHGAAWLFEDEHEGQWLIAGKGASISKYVELLENRWQRTLPRTPRLVFWYSIRLGKRRLFLKRSRLRRYALRVFQLDDGWRGRIGEQIKPCGMKSLADKFQPRQNAGLWLPFEP
jgi:hypothetical protein